MLPLPGDEKVIVPGCAFARGDQLPESVERRGALREEQHRRVAHHGDRRKIALEGVGNIIEERRVHGKLPGMRHQQRIAIRRRLGHCGGGDETVAAGPVLDDEVPAEPLAHLLRQDASARVDDAAGRERH